jgi:hypothetical protein
MSLDHAHLTSATAAILSTTDAQRVQSIREERFSNRGFPVKLLLRVCGRSGL